MTVENKVSQALVQAEALAASLKGFSMDTEDQQAQQMFQQLAQTTESTAQMLKARIQYIQSEEPQYRPEFKQQQQMKQQQNQQQ